MRYARRRQIKKLSKVQVTKIAHKVRISIAKRKGKDIWDARDLSLPNRTIKHRCGTYKETGTLDVMYAHPYNKRGIDRIYIVKGGTAIMKRVRPAHWPDNNPLRATIKLGPIIHSVSVEIDSIPVEIKI